MTASGNHLGVKTAKLLDGKTILYKPTTFNETETNWHDLLENRLNWLIAKDKEKEKKVTK